MAVFQTFTEYLVDIFYCFYENRSSIQFTLRQLRYSVSLSTGLCGIFSHDQYVTFKIVPFGWLRILINLSYHQKKHVII